MCGATGRNVIEQTAIFASGVTEDALLLEAINDLAPLGHLALSFNPLQIELSKTCAQMLGWGSAGKRRLYPRDLRELSIHPRAKHLRELRSFIENGGEKLVLSFVVTRPDGYRRQLRAAFRVTREDGVVLSCIAALTDETEQRRREAGLRATLATVPSAMIVIDEQGFIRAFSAAAVAMFGHSEKDAVGRKIDLLMPEPHRSQHISYLDRYVNSGEARILGQSQALNAVRADGTEFPIELWVGDASTESERLFTGFIRDQSQRMETEAKLQSLQNDLVHVARLSAVSELSLSLAHELNQPLAAIVNYLSAAEFIAANAPAPSGTKLIETMQRASDQAMRAGEIVKRLRTFVEKGEADMRIEPVGQIIREAASLLALTIRRKGISLDITIEDEEHRVLGDRIQLEQVLFNLMRNAIEALEGSGQTERNLVINSRKLDDGSVEISIEDNGPGIPPTISPICSNHFPAKNRVAWALACPSAGAYWKRMGVNSATRLA